MQQLLTDYRALVSARRSVDACTQRLDDWHELISTTDGAPLESVGADLERLRVRLVALHACCERAQLHVSSDDAAHDDDAARMARMRQQALADASTSSQVVFDAHASALTTTGAAGASDAAVSDARRYLSVQQRTLAAWSAV